MGIADERLPVPIPRFIQTIEPLGMPELRDAEVDWHCLVKRGLHDELTERLHGVGGVRLIERVDLRVLVQEPRRQLPGRW
eukprot:8505145-Prorocentrum_lima.AAC.1